MKTLTKREAKRRAKDIKGLVKEANAELEAIEKKYDEDKRAWKKKWAKTAKEDREERAKLVDVCPHDLHYEMSFAQCSICGWSYNRSH